MKPVGYVSDETFSAICDAVAEFRKDGETIAVVRSAPTGALFADISDGEYQVTLSKGGFGSKTSTAQIVAGKPWQFRLLTDGLLGYVWPKWVRGGEKSEFRVHSVEAYRLSLWRYGASKEFVRLIGWFDEHAPRAVMQILPDGDFTQTGVEWNQRGYPKNFPGQMITAPERSGLYYFHAETESGRFFSFPWVVAPKKPVSKVAVIASTNTWNAYNNFGGRSNYINTTSLPAVPTVNSRQDLTRYNGEIKSVWEFPDEDYSPLSFDRPEPFNMIPKGTEITDPVRGRQPNHLAPAEWRLMGWMEREGFGYDLYSDYQLHDGTLNLDEYEVVIISTHPEYWSADAFFKVKKWVFERGGKLMYLGGNGLDCEIQFLDAATMHFRTHYPAPVPGLPYTDAESGKTIECRMHLTTGVSPASLLGVVFTEPGIGTGAPFKVVDASHWIFKGTGLKDGDLFGTESQHERSVGGASGHETDKISGSSPSGVKALARGENVDDGGAEIVYFETESGGRVFSVGSINWSTSVLVDEGTSAITRNVLEAFLG